jgi:hypothetical protein
MQTTDTPSFDHSENVNSQSMFQEKYDEFVADLLGALPEYSESIKMAKDLDFKTRLSRFQSEIKPKNQLSDNSAAPISNPGYILPGVTVSDDVWNALSFQSQKAILEHIQILSMCSFMESATSGGDSDTPPAWMDDAMNEMKKKLDSPEFLNMASKFSKMFMSGDGTDGTDGTDEKGSGAAGFASMFEKGFPKLPERFLKGQLAKLAQEIVKDITADDLGLSPDMIQQCEKDPSRAFTILFSTFTSRPEIIQKTVAKIGKRLQQKVQSGQIRPQEIAAEAEELMKEFANNPSFVDMMEGIKTAFGFEDMDSAKKAGKEGSARLSMARDRLRKKLDKKKETARENLANKNKGK